MSEVKTLILPGSPTSAGTSKASIERTTIKSATARNAGSASRIEMRVTVRKMPAPLMRAASSYSALAWANPHRSSRKAKRQQQKPFDQDHAGHGIDVEA